MMVQFLKNRALTFIVLGLLGTVPLLMFWSGSDYLSLATKLVCLCIAATSLNLILGYGGMVSFGHAVFFGIGAYAVGIPAYHSVYGGMDLIATSNGFFHIGFAIVLAALFALITGAISLRTKGIHFIMITLAFSQMMFYFLLSLDTYGGDDGLTIDERSQLPFISLDNSVHMFLLSFGALLICLYMVHRIVNSRFGLVLQGAKDNEERMAAIGYNTFAYRLTAYVISGAMCGLAGALFANSESFVFPELIDWTRSGELIFMVILGGGGTIIGPVIGGIVFIVLEDVLSRFTIYWHLPFGIMLILAVLLGRTGIANWFKSDGAIKKPAEGNHE